MRVLHLSSWKESCGIATYTADLIKAMEGQGIVHAVHPIGPAARKYLTYRELKEDLVKLSRVVRDHDLIHIQHEYSFFRFSGGLPDPSHRSFIALLEILRTSGKPYVVTFHSVPPDPVPWTSLLTRPRRIGGAWRTFVHWTNWKWGVGRHFRSGSRSAAIVHMRTTRQQLVRSGLDSDAIVFIPHGVEPHRPDTPPPGCAAALERLGYPKGTALIVLCGFVTSHKGGDVALRALDLLPPEFHLAFVGGPHPEGVGDRTMDSILDFVHKHGRLSNRTRITGFVPKSTAAEYLNAATVCLVPYHDVPYSGSGAIGWSMSSGRPVIASRIKPFVEIQEESSALILVTPNAPHELAWQIGRLHREPESGLALVEMARTYCETNRWQRAGSATLATYRRLLNQAGTGTHARAAETRPVP